METGRLIKNVVGHAFPVAGAVMGAAEGFRNGDNDSRAQMAADLGNQYRDYRESPKDPLRLSRRMRIGAYVLSPMIVIGAVGAAVIDTNRPQADITAGGGHGTIIAEYTEKLGCYGGNVTHMENSWAQYSHIALGFGGYGVHGTMKVTFSGDVNQLNCINKDRGLKVTYTPDKEDPSKYNGNILVMAEGMEIQVHDENVSYSAPITNWAQNVVDAANLQLKAISLGSYDNTKSTTAYQKLQAIARMEGEKTAIEVCGPMAFSDYKDEYSKELADDVKGWDGGKYKVPAAKDIKSMNVTYEDNFDKIAFQYPYLDEIQKAEQELALIGKNDGDSVQIHQASTGTCSDTHPTVEHK